ncbi:hypothetical protein Taro_015245 [Colocasia esculenta]|uniref:Uncharacterized protein n=1 Tax=Colocasia esculenta TaxID=4460 RepID=A0A843ULL4_COLES|nr:hypothetical protein [Colocasia esculenta]
MDIAEDEMEFPPPAEPSPPHHCRRLKRLKKVSAVGDLPALQTPASDSAPVFGGPDEDAVVDVVPDVGVVPDPGRSADGMSPAPGSDGSDERVDLDDGLDPLFGDSYRFEGSGGADMGDEVEMEASQDLEEGDNGSSRFREAMDDPGKKKSAKKRLSMEGGEGKHRKKRTSSGEGGGDGKAEESARNKRKLEKERKAHLEQLHAESQRLLRETRDASFRPATVVEKPISSVLEKIRRRKLEILKISSVSNDTDRIVEANSPVVEPAIAESDSRQHSESIEVPERISGNEDEIPKSDTQEAQETSDDHQHCNRENDQPEDCNDVLQDNNGESSLLSAYPDVNSDPSDDTSSDEEDYDKENVDPGPEKPVNVNLYRKNDLAKSFVDEEAEEEDDSDHDLMRFKENDEEEGSEEDEDEVLDDLIASGYEEMPLDNEKRNELHQKWLQQQDAVATDNVLQRLNCGKERRDPLLLDDENDDGEPGENSSQESLNTALPANDIRQHSRKAKQMIAQMFTDAEDAYISSDDEETEQRLFRQRLLLEQTVSIFHVLEMFIAHSNKYK